MHPQVLLYLRLRAVFGIAERIWKPERSMQLILAATQSTSILYTSSQYTSSQCTSVEHFKARSLGHQWTDPLVQYTYTQDHQHDSTLAHSSNCAQTHQCTSSLGRSVGKQDKEEGRMCRWRTKVIISSRKTSPNAFLYICTFCAFLYIFR